MKLGRLLGGIKIISSQGFSAEAVDISGIACDSRKVEPGCLFVAVRGPARDGRDFIDDAVCRGARAVIVDPAARLPGKVLSVPCLVVENSRDALCRLADEFFGFPYRAVKCVGITGTNGKTTVSYLVRSVLKAAGEQCGLIGTIGAEVGGTSILSQNTTPGILELHKLFRDMADAGNRYVAMEVSSHALDQERVAGIIFEAAIFTNLTQDHLDYHKTMEEYFLAKQKFFRRYAAPETCKIINAEDAYGSRLLASMDGRILRYGFSPAFDVGLSEFRLSKNGSSATLKTPRGRLDIETGLIGRHNLCNILAAVAFGISQEMDLATIKTGIEAVRFVPGRLERFDSHRGFTVFVDYAHTDDALKNVLESLRAVAHNGRILTVFGCGGDRDRTKRPKMGSVAAGLSDYCVLTSDNPRSEDPAFIVADIRSGIKTDNFFIELDRMRAIEKALKMAQRNDIVLVAGKGHELYQVVKGESLPFDDRSAVAEILGEIDADV